MPALLNDVLEQRRRNASQFTKFLASAYHERNSPVMPKSKSKGQTPDRYHVQSKNLTFLNVSNHLSPYLTPLPQLPALPPKVPLRGVGLVGVAVGVSPLTRTGIPIRVSPTLLKKPCSASLISVPKSRLSRSRASGKKVSTCRSKSWRGKLE